MLKDTTMEPSKHNPEETEVMADGTVEKGLGPADALVQAGNLYGFQLITIKILGKEEDKEDWQELEAKSPWGKTVRRQHAKPLSLPRERIPRPKLLL